MIRILAAFVLMLAAASPGTAGDGGGSFRIGADAYLAGRTVVADAPGVADLFAAGGWIDLAAAITGNAHLAGRRVEIKGDVGGDVYAAGAAVSLAAPVAGNATLAGYDVTAAARVGGNLRAAANNLTLAGPVAGTGLLAAETISLNAPIEGDVVMAAEELIFGPEARIGGHLILYAETDARIDVPARVIPADRVERRAPPRPEATRGLVRHGWLVLAAGFLLGILVVAALATLAAALAPERLERMRELGWNRPFRTLWIGFLTLSALVGAVVLLVLSVIGIIAAPVVLVMAIAMVLLGYVLGTYLLGRAAWDMAGQLAPDTLVERALVALIGAALAALLALVPFVGWLVIFALTLIGVGGFGVAALRPEFRA